MSFLKNIWKHNSRHEKLSEELALQNTKEVEVESDRIINDSDLVTFKLKYLGSTVVEKITGDNISAEAVKNILKVAKAQRKKLQRVNMVISLKGIVVTDSQGNDLLKISIYRISNCSTDSSHRQIFSFTSTDTHETTECHAFLCPKRKLAESVALTVAHAFTTAYEAWRILPSTRQFEKYADETETCSTHPVNHDSDSDDAQDSARNRKDEGSLIELDEADDEPTPLIKIPATRPKTKLQKQLQREWVSFDDDLIGTEQSDQKDDLLVM